MNDAELDSSLVGTSFMQQGSAKSAPAWDFRQGLAAPSAVTSFLDQAADWLSEPEFIPIVWPRLLSACTQLRDGAADPNWVDRLRDHRLTEIIREEPATSWSARKPRGYSGDAHLMDFLYEHPSVRASVLAASPRGRALNAMVASSRAPVAVQERRRLLARLLDQTAERVPNAEVMVVAAGHLREAEFSASLGTLRRLVVLDQDPASIAEVTQAYGNRTTLYPITSSVGRLMVRPLVHGRFDLIYAAGLYDYLDEPTAVRMTLSLFAALRPGGRLLFANFCTGVEDYGYMDAFMDWRLILRDEQEMRVLIDALPAADMERASMFRGANGAIVNALVEKRADLRD